MYAVNYMHAVVILICEFNILIKRKQQVNFLVVHMKQDDEKWTENDPIYHL